MRPRPLALALLALLAFTPSAAAHTSVFSADGTVRAVIGQLNEPVVTYAKTGLDICFQENDGERTPIAAVNPGALTATLVGPDGSRLSQALRSQFGRPGCFQFQEPYILTLPGQYKVDLEGDVNGTPVSFRDVAAGGPVVAQENLTFPHPAVPDLRALAAENAALRSDLAELQAQVGLLESEHAADDGSGIPAPALLPLALAAAAALAMRRRPEE